MLLGCQVLLGIDDTTFQPDAGASDGGTNDAAPADASGDGSAIDAAPAPSVKLSPASIYVRQNESVDVGVTIVRDGFAGDVTLTLGAVGDAGTTGLLPGARGISAPVVVIPAGSSTGTITVSASAVADLGNTTLDFQATFDSPVDVQLPALVGGAAGTVDITFGTNGVVSDVGSNVARGVAVAPDGSFYVAGGTANWLLRHYFADGSADATFDATVAGIASINGGIAWDVTVHGTSLLVGGRDSTGKFAVRRFSTSGALDVTFGTSGLFVPGDPVGPQTGDAYGVGFSSTGEGYAVGTITQSGTTGVAFRFPPVGNTTELQREYDFDDTVLPHGIVPVPSLDAFLGATVMLPDGGSAFLVETLDPGFVDAGVAIGGAGNHGLHANGVAATSDGGVVVAGVASYDPLPGDSFVTFGTAPLAPLVDHEDGHNGTWDSNGYNAVAVQADGKILVVDDGGGSQSQYTEVRRYLASGAIDPSFGTSGSYQVGVSGNGPQTNFKDVAVAPDGRIIAVGSNQSSGIYITRIWP